LVALTKNLKTGDKFAPKIAIDAAVCVRYLKVAALSVAKEGGKTKI
jgi:hypothetical protein